VSERSVHAALELLDPQIVDARGHPVGKVDDVELASDREDSRLKVDALLQGPQALGPRLGGRIGEWMAAIGRRLAGSRGPARIPFALVEDVGVTIRLKVRVDEIPQVMDLEDWLLDRFIGRIPGASNGSE
jgi:sporulation protein YlmC with PRC-barrel domain